MKLQIERVAHEKILAYTDLCPDEISGLGKVEVRDGVLVVTDVAIFEQVVSSAHSTIETKALAKFQDERIRAGESMKQWYFWWHSHANMGVFFSGTDTGTIDSSTEFPHLVSMVVNKKHEYKARLDVFSPVRLFTDLELEILEVANAEIKALCQTEIDAKVKKPAVTHYQHHRSSDFNIPPKHNSGFQSEKDRTRSFLEMDTDLGLDWEARNEYFQHRKYLKGQVEFLRAHGGSKRSQKALTKLEQQLKEHVAWGKKMFYEDDLDSILLGEKDWHGEKF